LIVLARRDGGSYIEFMASRPCKPDADLKWLWQTLLPGVPLPACGTPENSDTAGGKSIRTVTDLRDDARFLSAPR